MDYFGRFVTKCRNFRGTFKDGAWYFDDSLTELVKETMVSIFGVDGTTEVERCTLMVKDMTDYEQGGPVTVFGRTVAKAFGRDSGAKLGDDIVFISGRYESGGSTKNWRTMIANATFMIKNFPVARVEFKDVQQAIEDGWCEVKHEQKRPTKAEIERKISEHLEAIEQLKSQLAN